MAADLAARTDQTPTSEEREGLEAIGSSGVQRTTVTEMMSMAASPSTMMPVAGEPEGGRSGGISVLQ